MAIYDRLTRCGDVDELLENARISMRSLDFRLAEAFLQEAELQTKRADIPLLTGQCHLFQGKAAAAVPCFHRAWESAKHQGMLEFRWKACIGLAQAHRELQESHQACQYERLALTAIFEGISNGVIESPPAEVLFANALQKKIMGDQSGSVSDLLSLHHETRDPGMRARIELSLAEAHPDNDGLKWLQKGWRNFHQAGDLSNTIKTLEQLAKRLLAQGEWNEGHRAILLAQSFAEHLGLRTRVAVLHDLAARLHRSLAVLENEAERN